MGSSARKWVRAALGAALAMGFLTGALVVSSGTAGATTVTFTSTQVGMSGSTPVFSMSGPWVMQWSYHSCETATLGSSDGNFSVTVRQPSGDSQSDVGADELGASGSGTDHYYDTGSFNLSVTSSCSWSIVVESSSSADAALPATFTSSAIGSSGSTQQFRVIGTWSMHWSYGTCSGSSGSFIVKVQELTGGLSTDVGPNELGPEGSGTDTYTSSGTFDLEVTSECAWSITVAGTSKTATPRVTSPATARFTVGKLGTFTIVATPSTAKLSASGKLPAGLTLLSTSTNTGTISGTPAAGTGGVYKLTITASNSLGTSPQAFTLIVDQAPVFTSPLSAVFTSGISKSFAIATSAYPVARVYESGKLPKGLSFRATGDGKASIAGKATTAKTTAYTVELVASNGIGAPVVRVLTLTIASGSSGAAGNAALGTEILPGIGSGWLAVPETVFDSTISDFEKMENSAAQITGMTATVAAKGWFSPKAQLVEILLVAFVGKPLDGVITDELQIASKAAAESLCEGATKTAPVTLKSIASPPGYLSVCKTESGRELKGVAFEKENVLGVVLSTVTVSQLLVVSQREYDLVPSVAFTN